MSQQDPLDFHQSNTSNSNGQHKNRSQNSHTRNQSILANPTNQLYLALALILVLAFSLLLILTAPKPTLEQQVQEITKQNRSTWEHLNRIRESTQWDKISKKQ